LQITTFCYLAVGRMSQATNLPPIAYTPAAMSPLPTVITPVASLEGLDQTTL
jgi:hypothetical protein